jgi:hypothetical protein
MKIEEVMFPWALVRIYQTICHTREESSLNIHCHENLESHSSASVHRGKIVLLILNQLNCTVLGSQQSEAVLTSYNHYTPVFTVASSGDLIVKLVKITNISEGQWDGRIVLVDLYWIQEKAINFVICKKHDISLVMWCSQMVTHTINDRDYCTDKQKNSYS